MPTARRGGDTISDRHPGVLGQDRVARPLEAARRGRSVPRVIVANAAMAVGYYVLGRIGFAVATGDLVTPVWPAGGAALALFLRPGPWLCPGVVLGLVALWFFPDLPVIDPPRTKLSTIPFMVLADVSEPIVGAALLARALGPTRSLRRVNDVAHDLRAPLRAISAYTTLLQERPSVAEDAEAVALFDRAKGAASRMGALIDDLLAFARLGRTPLGARTVDVRALAEEVAAEVFAGCGEAPTLIIGDLPPGWADPALLRQVLSNLLENAEKYTRGRPARRVEVGSTETAAGTAWFVRDNGVGFDMAYAGKLFKVFSRLHGAEFEGTGIGLAIAARVIERHGGRIWIEGAVDRGATVYFTLPPAQPVAR